MIIRSDFPGGSLGAGDFIIPGLWRGTTRHCVDRDNLHDQRYWFQFDLIGAAGSDVAFELHDVVGRYRGGVHAIFDDHVRPVVSEDGGHTWKRVDLSSWDELRGIFYFRHQFTSDCARIAYAHPYSDARMERLLSWLGSLPGPIIEPIGQSAEGRDLVAITIGQTPCVFAGPIVAVTGLLHSGEDCACWFAEGLIRALCAEDYEGARLRAAARWHIAPKLNPDGAHRGLTRLTARARDANAFWDLPDCMIMDLPELVAARAWLGRVLSPGSRSILIDVHSWSQFIPGHGIHSLDESLADVLLSSLHQLGRGDWIWHPFSRVGTCSWWSKAIQGVSCSATLELGQGLSGSGGRYLLPEDYLALGAATPVALLPLLEGR